MANDLLTKVASALIASNETPFNIFCAGVSYGLRHHVATEATAFQPQDILHALETLDAVYADLKPLSGIRKDVAEVYLKVLDEQARAV